LAGGRALTENNFKRRLLGVMEWIQLGSLLASIAMLCVLYVQVRESTKTQMVNNLIALNQQMYPCPKINEIFTDIEEGKKLFKKNGGAYSEVEIANFLGYFEMIGIIQSKGLLDKDIINDMFSNDISAILKNIELIEYIDKDNDATWPYLRKLEKEINPGWKPK